MRSLGLTTELLALDGVSTVERHPDRILLRAPAEPDDWSGNMLISLARPGDAVVDAARFAADYLDARHLKVAWDDPALDPAPLRAPRLVILAEAVGDAGRLYRRAGFAFAETVTSVQRRAY